MIIKHCISLHLMAVYLYTMGSLRLVISCLSNYRPSTADVFSSPASIPTIRGDIIT